MGNLFETKVDANHLKSELQNAMKTAALLSGFATAMTFSITGDEIRSYANFIKSEFFGRDSHLCSWVQRNAVEEPISAMMGFGGSPRVHQLPNSMDVPNGDACDARNCWLGHWQTNQASKDLDLPLCSVNISVFKARFPAYYADLVEDKVVSVQHELGFYTMAVIMICIIDVFLASLLLFSLGKRSDRPKDWVDKFGYLVMVVQCLPMVIFYNFMQLANRVVRIKLPFCDDFISDTCMVSSTPYFESLLSSLTLLVILVLLMHVSLPPVGHSALEDSTLGADAAPQAVDDDPEVMAAGRHEDGISRGESTSNCGRSDGDGGHSYGKSAGAPSEQALVLAESSLTKDSLELCELLERLGILVQRGLLTQHEYERRKVQCFAELEAKHAEWNRHTATAESGHPPIACLASPSPSRRAAPQANSPSLPRSPSPGRGRSSTETSAMRASLHPLPTTTVLGTDSRPSTRQSRTTSGTCSGMTLTEGSLRAPSPRARTPRAHQRQHHSAGPRPPADAVRMHQSLQDSPAEGYRDSILM